MGEALVYLVTGGCGFIGEHIVELLCKEDYVSEVRVFDSVAGEEVKKFATGTENVLKACCTLSVPYVVYTSSIAAVGPNTRQEPMLRGTEDTKYSGEVELPYGKTKAMAEKLVLEANGKELSNGGKLATCIICPNTIYGEKYLVLKDLHTLAKAKGGVLDYLEPEDTERNCTYVGNVAWMHVLAARNLQLKPDVLGGQVYYSYDDTPTRKGFLVRYQLLSGMDPSIRLGSRIPYRKLWLQIYVYRIIRILLYPFWKPQPFLNLPLLNTITTTFSYETDKAFRHFGYTPLYSWGESKRRTTEWLKSATKNSRSHQHHGKET